MKCLAVVVEHDRSVKSKVDRLAVENRNRLDERKLACLGDFDIGDVVAKSQRFDIARRREDSLALDLGPIIQHDAGRACPFSTWICETPLRSLSSPPSPRNRRTKFFRMTRTPLNGRPKPSR